MKCFTGIHITQTHVHAEMVSENYAAIRTHQIAVDDAFATQEGLLGTLAKVAKAIDPSGKSVAYGLSIPATISRWEGVLRSVPTFPQWEGCHLKEELEARIHGHVLMDSDANCTLAGEWLTGEAGRHQDIIAFLGDNHIRASLLMHGHLWRGGQGMAGTIASARSGTGRTLGETMSEQDGSEEKRSALATAIGTVAGNLVNTLDIRTILIAGSLAAFTEGLRTTLIKAATEATHPALRKGLTLIAGSDNPRSAIIGAAFNWQLQPHD
jgi:predicted NBD/HSP70 family sugar kinase